MVATSNKRQYAAIVEKATFSIILPNSVYPAINQYPAAPSAESNTIIIITTIRPTQAIPAIAHSPKLLRLLATTVLILIKDSILKANPVNFAQLRTIAIGAVSIRMARNTALSATGVITLMNQLVVASYALTASLDAKIVNITPKKAKIFHVIAVNTECSLMNQMEPALAAQTLFRIVKAVQ